MPEEVDELDAKTEAVFKRKGYKILKPLGHGNFGTVFKAKIIETGEFAAVKVMNLERVQKKFKEKFLPREMAAMIESKHKNVIRVYDIIKANKKLFIFMEFAGNGDILGYLKKNKAIPLKLCNKWFKQSLEGLEYLHNKLYISHRDIKVDNILLDDENNAKISDFGFAKKSSNGKRVTPSETYCGTRDYQCPEIIKEEPYDPFKADAWAMGVCLFVMLNDKYPYHTLEKAPKLLKEMQDTEYLDNRFKKEVCKHAKRLNKKMLAFDESERYTIKEALENKWIEEKAKCCEE